VAIDIEALRRALRERIEERLAPGATEPAQPLGALEPGEMPPRAPSLLERGGALAAKLMLPAAKARAERPSEARTWPTPLQFWLGAEEWIGIPGYFTERFGLRVPPALRPQHPREERIPTLPEAAMEFTRGMQAGATGPYLGATPPARTLPEAVGQIPGYIVGWKAGFEGPAPLPLPGRAVGTALTKPAGLVRPEQVPYLGKYGAYEAPVAGSLWEAIRRAGIPSLQWLVSKTPKQVEQWLVAHPKVARSLTEFLPGSVAGGTLTGMETTDPAEILKGAVATGTLSVGLSYGLQNLAEALTRIKAPKAPRVEKAMGPAEVVEPEAAARPRPRPAPEARRAPAPEPAAPAAAPRATARPGAGYFAWSSTEGEFVPKKGQPVQVRGFEEFDFFVARPLDSPSRGWQVYEAETGRSIALGATRDDAANNAKAVLFEQGPEATRKAIEATIAETGRSPRYGPAAGPEAPPEPAAAEEPEFKPAEPAPPPERPPSAPAAPPVAAEREGRVEVPPQAEKAPEAVAPEEPPARPAADLERIAQYRPHESFAQHELEQMIRAVYAGAAGMERGRLDPVGIEDIAAPMGWETEKAAAAMAHLHTVSPEITVRTEPARTGIPAYEVAEGFDETTAQALLEATRRRAAEGAGLIARLRFEAPEPAAPPAAGAEASPRIESREEVRRILTEIQQAPEAERQGANLVERYGADRLQYLQGAGYLTRYPDGKYGLTLSGLDSIREPAAEAGPPPEEVAPPRPAALDLGPPEQPKAVGWSQYFRGEMDKEPAEKWDLNKLRGLVADRYGLSRQQVMAQVKEGSLRWGPIQNAYESALVKAARETVETIPEGGDVEGWIESLHENQANLSQATTKTKALQQFPTPLPISYILQRHLGVDQGLTTFEPTAGTGALVFAAPPGSVVANELDPLRADLLRSLGVAHYVREEDARGYFERHPEERGRYEVVIANPPFGRLEKPVEREGFVIRNLEHLIALDALEGMADQGRAALIIGGNNFQDPFGKELAELTEGDKRFLGYLHSRYNVTHNIDLPGKVYEPMGAGFPIRVITIEGRRPEPVQPWYPETPEQVEKADTFEQLRGILAAREAGHERPKPRPAQVREGAPPGAPAVPAEPRGAVGPAPRGEPAGVSEPRAPRGRPAQPRPRAEPQPRRPGVERRGVEPLPVGERPERAAGGRAEAVEPPRAGEPGAEPGPPVRGPERVVARRGAADALNPEEAPQENELQAPYAPEAGSKAPGVRMLSPRHLIGPEESALGRLRAEVGETDEFVASELGYESAQQMHDSGRFHAGQVDGIALAIAAAKRRGGFILGDMAGSGKGRILAAMVLWGRRQGYRPIFLTARAKLLTDFWRDIKHVGGAQLKPFVMYSDPQGDLLDPDTGQVVMKAKATKQLYRQIVANPDQELADYDFVVVPYTQLNMTEAIQRQVIQAMADDNLLLMDETHRAGGAESGIARFFRGQVVRGVYEPGVLDRVAAAIYSSATFSKRPETGLYNGTSVADASQEAMEAIRRGGPPLQGLVTQHLAEQGEYRRLEIDWAQVERIDLLEDRAHKERDAARQNAASEVWRLIDEFDRAKETYLDDKWRNTLAEQRRKRSRAQRQGWAYEIEGVDVKGRVAEAVGSTTFASKFHNCLDQFSLAQKAAYTADRALAALRQGEKPIIILSNTMGSALDRAIQEQGVKAGEQVDFTWRNMMRDSLESCLTIQVKEVGGRTHTERIKAEDLSPGARALYEAAASAIEEFEPELPASPIDWIIAEMERQGQAALGRPVKVGEITGRTLRLDYSGAAPVVTKRSAAELNRNAVVNGFNSGKLDALIYNNAGSEGMSVHASRDFKDQRPRVALVAQPSLNVDEVIQALGRPFRIGQVVKPRFEILMTALPTERRPAAVLAGKLKMLQANVAADQETRFALSDIPNMMNQHGNDVARSYLEEHPELNERLGDPLKAKQKDKPTAFDPGANMMARLTGRLRMLPVEEQEIHLTEIEANYGALIQHLNEIGENDLETSELDLQATVRSRTLLLHGPDESNWFTSNSYLDELEVDVRVDRWRREELDNTAREARGNLTGREWVEDSRSGYPETGEQAQKYLEQYEAQLRAAGTYGDTAIEAMLDKRRQEVDGQLAYLRKTMEEYSPGDGVRFTTDQDADQAWALRGIVVRYRSAWEPGKGGSPAAPSSWEMLVALENGSQRELWLSLGGWAVRNGMERVSHYVAPYTGWGSYYGHGIPDDWDERAKSEARGTRYVVTGNLVGAMEQVGFMQDRPVNVVRYTLQGGGTADGILLPQGFDPGELPETVAVGPDEAFAHLRRGGQLTTESPRLWLEVRYRPPDHELQVDTTKTKSQGGQLYLHEGALSLVEGGEFFSVREIMRGIVKGDERVAEFLKLLSRELGVSYGVARDHVEAAAPQAAAADEEPIQAARASPKAGAEPQAASRRARMARPVSQREVVRVLVQALEQPHRQGRMRGLRRTVGGIFKRLVGVSRARNMYDVGDAAHEMGHGLDRRHGWSRERPFWADLARFGDPEDLGPKSSWESGQPNRKRRAEGVAEFTRRYIQEPELAKRSAPTFAPAFERALREQGVLDEIEEAQQLWQAYLAQAPADKLRAATDYAGQIPSEAGLRVVPWWTRLPRDVVDDLFPVRWITERVFGSRYEEVPPTRNPYVQMRLTRGASERGHKLIREGNERTMGLEQILELSGDKSQGYRDFQDYCRARMLRSYAEQGRPTGDFSRHEVERILQRYESPNFGEAFEELQTWFQEINRIEADFHTADVLEARQKRPYVPMRRAMEAGVAEGREEIIPQRVARRFANQSIFDPRYVGRSKRPYRPWLEVAYERAYSSVQRAMQNRAMLTFIDILKTNPQYGKLLEPVPPDLIPHPVLQELRLALERAPREIRQAERVDELIDLVEMLPEEVFDLKYWQNVKRLTNGQRADRIIFVMRQGRPEFYQVGDPMIYDALVGAGVEERGLLLQIAAIPTNTLRAGVTLDPGFIFWTNLVRDSLDAYIKTEGRLVPFWDTSWGIRESFLGGEVRRRWVEAGGALSGTGALDRPQVRRQVARLGARPRDRTVAALKEALDGLRRLRDASEMANRIPAFQREMAAARKRHPDWSEEDLAMYGAFRSRDLLDFAMRGRVTAKATYLIAFARSAINGMAKMAHETARDPRRILIHGGALALATALLYYLNRKDEDYWALTDYERDMYWHVKIPGSREFLRIPSPYEWGVVFKVAVEDALRRLQENDSRAFETLMETAIRSAWPGTPDIYQLSLDLAANRQSFTGAPIAPEYLVRGDSAVRPEDQYTPATSPTMRRIGQTLGVSPAKLEYAARQIGGPAGGYAVSLTDWMLAPVTGELPSRTWTPLARLATRPSGYTAMVTRLRDREEEVQRDYASVRLAMRRGKALQAAETRARELGYPDLAGLAQKRLELARGLHRVRILQQQFYETEDARRKYLLRSQMEAVAQQALAMAGYDYPLLGERSFTVREAERTPILGRRARGEATE